MDNPQSNEFSRWTEDRVASLAPPADWQPDANAARMRMNARIHRDSRPRPYWLVGIGAAMLACVAMLAIHPARGLAQQSVGKGWYPFQQAWYWFTLVHTRPIVTLPGTLPADAKSLQPVVQGGVSEMAGDIHPMLPHAGVLSAKPRFSVMKPASYSMDINRAELQAALRKRRSSDQIPESWDRVRITMNIGTTVVAKWADVAEWSELVLVQGPMPVITTPKDFDLAEFSAVNLRATGWGLGAHPDSLAALVKRGTTAAALLYGRGAGNYVHTIREVELQTGMATLIEDLGDGRIERITLLWSVSGRAYVLRGALKESLGFISPDLAGALVNLVDLANSVR